MVTGYSAHLDASSEATFWQPLSDPPGGLLSSTVEGDVALVLATSGGLFDVAIVRAYSARTNSWATLDQPFGGPPPPEPYLFTPDAIAIRKGTAYHAFSARTGGWSVLNLSEAAGPLVGVGNVIAVDLLDPVTGAGTPQVAAFSAVLGEWSLSPVYAVPDSLVIGYDVAFVAAASPAGLEFRGAAYNAYDGTWTTSSVGHPFESSTIEVRKSLVRIEESDPARRFEAFGARTGQWSLLSGPYEHLALERDYTIARRADESELAAFGGLCEGAWKSRSIAAAPTPLGSPAHLGLVAEGGRLHAFLPASNEWAAVQALDPGATVTVADALCDVRGASFAACAARWGSWTSGGSPEAGASFETVVGGSLIAHRQLDGAGAGGITIFDERAGQWPGPFAPTGPATLVVGRNLLIAHPGASAGPPLLGYSVRSGKWTEAEGAATPLKTAPTATDDVAWMVDANDRLLAYGSAMDARIANDWPNGGGYHARGTSLGASSPELVVGLSGSEGELPWLFLSLAPDFPGTPLPPLAGLWTLAPPSFPIGVAGAVDAEGTSSWSTPLPPGGVTCVQAWIQVVFLDPASLGLRVGGRAVPAWLF